MLRRVVEDYLESIKEVQFFLPFSSLLMLKGYFDLHVIHGPTEFGKDIIAKTEEDGETLQVVFQLKAGDVNLNKLNSEIKPQLLEAVVNDLSHPNFDRELNKKIYLVTTGVVRPPATLALQAFNDYLHTKLNSGPILTIEKQDLVEDFAKYGLEPFFVLHNDPSFIGDFYDVYAKIKNEREFSSFDVEGYSKRWLELGEDDLSKLHVLFESYLFSNLLFNNKKYYESALFMAALVRYLVKIDAYEEYQPWLHQYHKTVYQEVRTELSKLYDAGQNLADHAASAGILGILKYSKICLHALELLSLCVLVSEEPQDETIDFITEIITRERGWERPLSDNYAASVALIGFALLKSEKIPTLRKFVNNITIWFCDRYENMGIAPIGSSEQEEFEHILSEYLDGLGCEKTRTSFLASVLLDLAAFADPDFYSSIANELRATSVILERYHVLEDSELLTYDRVQNSYDSTYSREYTKKYCNGIGLELESGKVALRSNVMFYLVFLLRDRIFPTFVYEVIHGSK